MPHKPLHTLTPILWTRIKPCILNEIPSISLFTLNGQLFTCFYACIRSEHKHLPLWHTLARWCSNNSTAFSHIWLVLLQFLGWTNLKRHPLESVLGLICYKVPCRQKSTRVHLCCLKRAIRVAVKPSYSCHVLCLAVCEDKRWSGNNRDGVFYFYRNPKVWAALDRPLAITSDHWMGAGHSPKPSTAVRSV